MSRLGKKPVSVPDGVEVSFAEGLLRVKGPKGEMTQEVRGGVRVEVDAAKKEAWVHRSGEARQDRAYHGLYRALLGNMVEGVTKGYTKELDIVGTGYRASVEGGQLVMQVGYSHPVKLTIPEGLTVTCPSQTQVVVTGVDKQKVGNFAAMARASHPPDPYHQKGVRYRGEQVRKLTGKTFGSTAT
jgi:large subunit ribosomal protein L6